ncbi:SMP-30/gluconolactonase/LRE family protein [Tomitella cavernea]|uniref:SMP-30/gluconolactonase/LRE family protein n=1 Tax=Tomitella cavernea TaxID=1387982 RepID=UPI001A910F57|nr:hypothetical protein [Tomitella cavernea]
MPVDMPGAVRRGPDGMMYVLAGNNPIGMIPDLRQGRILRFDPDVADPVAKEFARGFGMPNGLDFDADGNAYLADTAGSVVKVRPDGTVDTQWSSRAPKNFQLDRGVNVGGFDGLVVTDGAVYVSLIQSVSGRILRIPLDDPGGATVAADLTVAGIPLLPDDMAAAPDGTLYVATASGRLVHVDPASGEHCSVLSGQPMTAVSFMPGSDSDLAVSTELGDVLHVRLGEAG